MKRGRKKSGQQGEVLVKSTYLLTATMKQNLAYVALAEGKEQSDIVRDALIYYLRKRGLNPDKPPVFTFLNQESGQCNTEDPT